MLNGNASCFSSGSPGSAHLETSTSVFSIDTILPHNNRGAVTMSLLNNSGMENPSAVAIDRDLILAAVSNEGAHD